MNRRILVFGIGFGTLLVQARVQEKKECHYVNRER